MLTSFYLSLLALIYIKISWETIKARQKHQVSLGTGDKDELMGLVSAHSNFQAYTPIIILLLWFYENSALANESLVHALGLSVFAGRLLHYLGIKNASAPNFKLRVAGMRLTLIPLAALAALNLAAFVYATRIQG